MPPILSPRDGFLLLDRDKFHGSFAADLPAEQAAFMADSQVPWGVDALGGSITDPAWRTKPSWYLVTTEVTEDRMIPPPAQQAMSERAGSTVVEAAGSHAIYVSQPAAVAALIEQAASALTRASRGPTSPVVRAAERQPRQCGDACLCGLWGRGGGPCPVLLELRRRDCEW